MIRYVRVALGAHFRSGRTLFVLTVLGVALGVASVLSIQILNRNAIGAFAGSVRARDVDLHPEGRICTARCLTYLEDPFSKGLAGISELNR